MSLHHAIALDGGINLASKFYKGLKLAIQVTNTKPTSSQAKSGNYKKGRVTVNGLEIVIENPKGSKRSGVNDSGVKWENTMQAHYGYFAHSKGADNDEVDVFFTDSADQSDYPVFIINQVGQDKSFDEHKVMLGFRDIESAKQTYLGSYDDGWDGLGSIKEMSLTEFKEWLYNKDTTKVLDSINKTQHLAFDSAKLSGMEKVKLVKELMALRAEVMNGSIKAMEKLKLAKRMMEIRALIIGEPQTSSEQVHEAAAKPEEPIKNERKIERKIERNQLSTKKYYPDGNVELSASKRTKANKAAIAILEQIETGLISADDLTEAQKVQLAEYSGNGGGLVGRDGKTGSPYEYYTAKPLAESCWKLLEGAGFKGGKVLDPSAGTGIFGGTAPSNAVVDAIELDSTSGGVNKALNGGNGNVTISSFEAIASATPDESYDAVITNIPFGDNASRGANKMLDEKYQKESLETYFILRSLEKVKAGGTAVFISSSTFVKSSSYQRLRERASLMAEFVGAYRLPNAQDTGEKTKGGNAKEVSTFAGADVTSDILVFRKHSKNLANAVSTLVSDGRPDVLRDANVLWDVFTEGNYFKGEGKRFILGEETTGTGQYGEVQRVVTSNNIETTAALIKPFEKTRINLELIKESLGGIDDLPDPMVLDSISYKDGDVVYIGGKQMIYKDGEFVIGAKVEGDFDFETKLAKLQSPLSALMTDFDGDEVLQVVNSAREKGVGNNVPKWLRDYFVAVSGVKDVNTPYEWIVTALATRQVFDQHVKDMPFDFLSTYSELSKRIKLHTAFAKKAPSAYPEDIKSAAKFLASIHNNKTGFNPVWTGAGEKQVEYIPTEDSGKYDNLRYRMKDESGFIPMDEFKEVMPDVDPFNDDDWCLSPDGKGITHANDFYHGNYASFLAKNDYSNRIDAVKRRSGIEDDDEAKKLQDKLVRQAAKADERLIKIDPDKIKFNIFSPLVSAERKVEFLNKYVKDAAGGFFVSTDENGKPEIDYKGGTTGRAAAINEDDFDDRKLAVRRLFQHIKKKTTTTGATKEEKLKNPEREKARLERIKNLISETNQQFDVWARSNSGVQKSLEKRFGDPQNMHFIDIDESDPLDIPNINPKFIPHDYQNASIRRYARRMTGILGHDVGLGKTSQALLVAQHLQSIGVKNRTMFVVPNSTLSNWKKETFHLDEYGENKGVYTHNDDCLFVGLETKTNQKTGETVSRVKSKNYATDLLKVLSGGYKKIFITHSAFQMIPLKDGTIDDYKSYVQSVDASLDAKSESNKKNAIKKEGALAKLTKGGKNKSFPFFEDLGIDSLIIDEAHAYKNSKAVIEFEGAKQLSTAPVSQAGLDAQVKCWWLRSKNKLGDGVLPLTATPITNSPLEMYSMLSLAIGEEELNSRLGGIRGADEFMEMFCKLDQIESENLIGESTLTNVFTGLSNTSMLSGVLHGSAHIRTAKSVGLKIPDYSDVPVGIALPDHTKKKLTSLKSIYAAARRVESGKDARKEDLDLIAGIMEATGEGVELLAHPFNLISKMSNLILDEDLFNQSSIYHIDESDAESALAAINQFNQLEIKEERLEGRLTPASGENRKVLKQIVKEDKDGGDPITYDIVHIEAQLIDNKIVLDSNDFEIQSKLLKLLERSKVEVDVFISEKLAAMIENFKKEQAAPKSPKNPDAKPRLAKQIIFCDMLGMHHKLKIALSKLAGVPSSKITIVNGKSIPDPAAMQDVQDGFNAEGDDNQFHVVIANKKAEVGINLQKGCQAIHHLTVGWTPDSLQQRNGRGVRQGNYVKHINVYHYDADGTFDEYKRELVGVKSDWIGSLLNNNDGEDIAISGTLSRKELEELAEANGDAETVRKIKERKAVREKEERRNAEYNKLTGSLTSLLTNKETVETYEELSTYVDEKIIAALKTKRQIFAAQKKLKAELNKDNPVAEGKKQTSSNPAIIASCENSIANKTKLYEKQLKPIRSAVYVQNARFSIDDLFDMEKEVNRLVKDGKVIEQYINVGRYATTSISLNDESPLKDEWRQEVDGAQAMADKLRKEALVKAKEIGVDDSRIASVENGEAVILRGKIIEAGDFVKTKKGQLFVVSEINGSNGWGKDKSHKLRGIDLESEAQVSADEDILQSGEIINRESSQYRKVVTQAATIDAKFIEIKGGFAGKADTREKLIIPQHRYLYEAFNPDVLSESKIDKSKTTISVGCLDNIEIDHEIRRVMPETDSPVLSKIRDSQLGLYSIDGDTAVFDKPESIIQVTPASSNANEVAVDLLTWASRNNERLPLESSFYDKYIVKWGSPVSELINAHCIVTNKIGNIEFEEASKSLSVDGFTSFIAREVRDHYSLIDLSSLSDDEIFKSLSFRFNCDNYYDIEIARRQIGSNEEIQDQPKVTNINAYDSGYTTSDDGEYLCLSVGLMYRNKPDLQQFKDFFDHNGDWARWGASRASSKIIKNPPKNSWIVSAERYKQFVTEHRELVEEYDIEQV